MDGEKATDGGLERGSHPFFAAVIAAEREILWQLQESAMEGLSCMRHRRE